jgi:hypothetical protein
MSYKKAQDYFSENKDLLDSLGKKNLTRMVLGNLNNGLWNLSQAIEEDMDRVHFLLAQFPNHKENGKSPKR